jgi:hypothetical protein
MASEPKKKPRYLDYGIKPKPLLAKSLKRIESAREKLREVGALWSEICGSVEYEVDGNALAAIDELEKIVRESFEWLHEPMEES